MKPSPSIPRLYRSPAVHAGNRVCAILRELVEVAEAWLAQKESGRRKARNDVSGRGLRRAHGESCRRLRPRAGWSGIAPDILPQALSHGLAIGNAARAWGVISGKVENHVNAAESPSPFRSLMATRGIQGAYIRGLRRKVPSPFPRSTPTPLESATAKPAFPSPFKSPAIVADPQI